MKPLKVLILEDRPDDAELMLHELRRAGFEPAWQRVDSEPAYLERLSETLDVILADYSMPQFTATRAIRILKERGLNVPLIVVTGTLGEEAAVECMKQGAADYLLKDRLARLGPAVEQALEQRRLRDEHQQTLAARKQAEDALRASEASARLLGDILEHSSQPFAIGYPDGRIGSPNSAYCRLVGYCPDELKSMNWARDLTPPEWRDLEAERLEEVRRTGRPVRYEKEYLRRDRTRIPVELLVHLVRDEAGQPRYYYAFVTDLTERKRAEENNRRLAEIVDRAPIPISIYDFDGRLLHANQRTLNMHGYNSKEEFMAIRLHQLDTPESATRIASHMQKLRETGEATFEVAHFRKDGSVLPLGVTASVMQWDGRPVLLSMATDLTDRKKAEGRVAAYQRRLRSLGARLALAEENERRLIAADLHDGVAQGLALAKIKLQSLRTKAPPDAKAPLLEVETLVDHAVRSTRSLLFDLSPPPLYELGLEAAVEWLAERTQDEHKLAVTVDDDGRAKPLSDEIRGILFRAVRELLHNVVKYAKARQAKITLRREEGRIRIEVADDGVGFDAEKAPPPRDASGAGFGLFQIRERLDYVGGSIDIRSRPGCGTRVILLAPLNEGPAKA